MASPKAALYNKLPVRRRRRRIMLNLGSLWGKTPSYRYCKLQGFGNLIVLIFSCLKV